MVGIQKLRMHDDSTLCTEILEYQLRHEISDSEHGCYVR